MPTLGTTELIILLVIVLILFGGSRIGELGGALGRGIREFKTSVRDDESPLPPEKDAKDAKPSTTAAASTAPVRETVAPATSTVDAAPTTPAAAPGSAAAAGAPPPAGGASTGAATAGMTEVGATGGDSSTPRRDA